MDQCEMEHGMSDKTVERPPEEKQQLLTRLKRIEGQVRGIQKMIETDRYCVDILIQTSAIHAALRKVELGLLERHTSHCVKGAIINGEGDAAIDELMKVIEQCMKS